MTSLSDPRDFHVPQSSYTKEDLLKSSEGGYFGPGNAQLPAPPMLMMDRIIEISLDGGEFGKGHVVGELDITPELWFFDCHFPGDPVMPGCLDDRFHETCVMELMVWWRIPRLRLAKRGAGSWQDGGG